MKLALSATFLAAASLLLVGCGGGPVKNYNYHSGKGKIEGAVPANGIVMFLPVGDSNYIADGKIESDGSFVLTTHLAKPEKNMNGVPEGTYEVSIRVPNTTTVIGSPPLPDKVRVEPGKDLIHIRMQAQGE